VSRATVGVKKAPGPATEVAGAPARPTALVGRRRLILVGHGSSGDSSVIKEIVIIPLEYVGEY